MDASSALIASEQASANAGGFMGRMLQLSGIEAAMQQSQNVYDKIKASNSVVSTTISKAEELATRVLSTSPKEIDQQIPAFVSEQQTINETVAEVTTRVTTANSSMHSIKEFGKSKVHSLKELSWRKTNEVLASKFGMKALQGFDYASGFLEAVLDRYLPLSESDLAGFVPIVPADVDGLTHAVQTVGKMGKQLILGLRNKIKAEKTDIQNYVTSFAAYERLVAYLNKIYKCKPQVANEPKQVSTE